MTLTIEPRGQDAAVATRVTPARASWTSARKQILAWIGTQRSVILQGWYASQFDASRLARYAVTGVEHMSPQSIRDGFLAPLLDLLTVYVRTGETRFQDLYLDERLRFAPHRASPEVRAQFHREVLDADEETVIGRAEPELQSALSALFGDLHDPLRTIPTTAPVRMLALGDCLMNELRVFLTGECRRTGTTLDFRAMYFSARQGRNLSVSETLDFLKENPIDLIALSFLTYEGIPPYQTLLRDADRLTSGEIEAGVEGTVALIRQFLDELREHTDAPFLVHNASGLPLTRARKRLPFLPPLSSKRRAVIARMNSSLAELASHTSNALLIDEDAIVRQYGHRRAAQEIASSVAKRAFFHTGRLGEFLAEPYRAIIQSYSELRSAKVLLIDFDNTLWDGVMADGDVSHFHREQTLLRQLKDAGILLVAVSKNDPRNVRWHEMTLQPDDFVLHKISWQPKVQSITEAAAELDLGLDSFVLIDDNPAEREFVRTQLPTVRTLDPTSRSTWDSLERLLEFPNTRLTEEARTRTEMYRQQAQRRAVVCGVTDLAGMMDSLQLKVQFGRATRRDLDRVAELIQRTNQFNTTTRRHSRQVLESFLTSDKHTIFVASMNDKFGQLGLVAAVIVERRGDTIVVDSFVMSCRAMGFGLEHLILRLVLDAEAGAERFIGEFLPTSRNDPAAGLFSDAGFARTGDTTWELAAGAAGPESPSWIQVEMR